MNTYRFRNGRTVLDLEGGYRIQVQALANGAPLAVAYRVPGGSAAAFEGTTVEAALALARECVDGWRA